MCICVCMTFVYTDMEKITIYLEETRGTQGFDHKRKLKRIFHEIRTIY